MSEEKTEMEKFEHRIEKIESWKSTVDTRLAIVETNVQAIQDKLAKIDNNTTWILRIVIGAIVIAGLGYIIQKPGTPAILKFIMGGF